MSKQQKYECEIIQDLLPLYVDDVCSKPSVELIEEHMKTCEACHIVYKKMTETEYEDTLQSEEKAVMARYKQKVLGLIAWILGIALSVICTVISFPILLFVFYPYSPVGILAYLVVTPVWGILTKIKKTKALKIVMMVLLALPAIALLFLIIAFASGWLQWL